MVMRLKFLLTKAWLRLLKELNFIFNLFMLE
jgi:hypothetical protein